jgi:hypothetical protein
MRCPWRAPADSSPAWSRELAGPGDYVVFLGAGNITQWAYALPGELAALAGRSGDRAHELSDITAVATLRAARRPLRGRLRQRPRWRR